MSQQSDATAPTFLQPILTGWRLSRYVVLTVCWFPAAVFFWHWWLTPAHFIDWPRFLIISLPLAWVFLLQLFFLYVLMHASRSAAPLPAAGTFRVAMIVTKTPSEPFDVLRRTLEAMLSQDYPHDTWIADEDPTEETLQWCAERGVKVSSRKGRADYHRPAWPRRTRCKEGNLAFFYDHWGYSDYDIVAQLDADHVPQQDYLRAIIRPFADPAVGYVSAPSICSANAEESWAARTRLHSEAAFHGVFQSGYTAAFAPMCIGSHYAVRTAALKDIGGLGPELAEDHSTSMLMNAGGWRGVHAIDAIAFGDGPATVADMITQEFQWSRSLVTLLLQHTPKYLRSLPGRLKFLFVFCQLVYPMLALTAAVLYFAPIAAILFDTRYAEVTYPAFVGHALPTALIMIAIAFQMRRDHFFRPLRAPVLGWEKALFLSLQWPWVLWGCLMAVRDTLTGKFVDFRITPKGKSASAVLPAKVIGLYAVLALGCILPVLLAPDLTHARGFLLLSLLNAVIYASLVTVIVVHHIRENGVDWRGNLANVVTQFSSVAFVAVLLVAGFAARGVEGLHALSFGLEPLQLTRVEFSASGAGSENASSIHYVFDPKVVN